MEISDFLRTLEVRPRTIATYAISARRIEAALGDPGAASFRDLEAWWLAHPCAQTTKRDDLALLRRYYRWRRLHGLPAPDIDAWRPRTRTEDPERRTLTPDQAGQFLARLPEGLRLPVRVALLSGLRRGNIVPCHGKPGLLRAHVDLEGGAWNIPGELMKGGQPFRVPIHPQLLDLLQGPSLPSRSTQAFRTSQSTTDGLRGRTEPSRALLGAGGKTLDTRAAFARACGDGPALRWHDFRRTFATWLDATGATPFEIAILLGHRHLGVTGRYVLPSPEKLRETLNRVKL